MTSRAGSASRCQNPEAASILDRAVDSAPVGTVEAASSPSPLVSRRARGARHSARANGFQPWFLVAAAVGFGLIVLWPERADVWYLNDASVHRSMVRWAGDRLREGHLPFDGWYPYLSMGASRFHHYQSLPHIITGTLAVPIGDATFRWSLYLLLALWPIAVYAGGRLLGLGRWPAAAAALVSPLLASASGLGYEWGSYVWRGSGAWAQLWGMWALPFAWGCSWRAISTGRRLWLAALVLGVTMCVHLLTGYVAVWSLAVFVLVRPSELPRRLIRSVVVLAGGLAVAAWMLVPLLTDAGWTVNDEFSRGEVFYDSFGARRILTWLVTGRILDDGRLPVLTVLLAVGVSFALWESRRRDESRALLGLFGLSLLLFFGRTTWGELADLVPGGEDLFWRRFVSGVHLSAIYLVGLGGTWLVARVAIALRLKSSPRAVAASAVIITGLLLATPVIERVAFERQGAAWVEQQVRAQATDGVGFQALVEIADARGPGRIFAGLRAQDAADYRVGSVQGFASLLNLQTDAVGFTRPTWSLVSPSEFRFELSDPGLRELFGVRYVLRPVDQDAPSAVEVERIGRHVLSEYPDTGYLAVVDTVAPIVADRTNIGVQMSSFLSSSLPEQGLIPTVAFGGRPPAEPTLDPNDLPGNPPGEIVGSDALLDDGVFSGEVALDRPAVVMLKASFDPRWQAFVDGEPTPIQMLAPAFVGVATPAGDHEIRFEYRPYGNYAALFLLGAAALAAIWLAERWLARAQGRPAPEE